MAFREVRVFEVREVLRLWLAARGSGRWSGWSGWTARRSAATWRPRSSSGLVRDGGEEQLTDVFIGLVVEAVRPHRTRRSRRGVAAAGRPTTTQIAAWVEADESDRW